MYTCCFDREWTTVFRNGVVRWCRRVVRRFAHRAAIGTQFFPFSLDYYLVCPVLRESFIVAEQIGRCACSLINGCFIEEAKALMAVKTVLTFRVLGLQFARWADCSRIAVNWRIKASSSAVNHAKRDSSFYVAPDYLFIRGTGSARCKLPRADGGCSTRQTVNIIILRDNTS